MSDVGEVRVWWAEAQLSGRPIEEPSFKIGGAPVWIDEEPVWPTCGHCSKDMDFIGQVPLRVTTGESFAFSQSFNMAYAFQCPGTFNAKGEQLCDPWDPSSGGNRLLLQVDRGNRMVSSHPVSHPDCVLMLNEGAEPEIDMGDDMGGLDEERFDELVDRVSLETKVGGVPGWVQDSEVPACPACSGSTRFLAQFSSLPIGSHDGENPDWFCIEPGGQVIYLFLCVQECGPQGAAMLWQM